MTDLWTKCTSFADQSRKDCKYMCMYIPYAYIITNIERVSKDLIYYVGFYLPLSPDKSCLPLYMSTEKVTKSGGPFTGRKEKFTN